MENTYTPEQAINSIQKSLQQTQKVSTGASFYFKLWGALLFLHFMLNAFRIQYGQLNQSLFVNLSILVFPIGGILSGLRKKFDRQTEKVISVHEKVYFATFVTFALSYAVLFVSTLRVSPIDSVIFFPMLLGTTVLICGILTRFIPGILGGMLSIIISGFSIHQTHEMIYMLAALSCLLASIIPGILMRGKNV